MNLFFLQSVSATNQLNMLSDMTKVINRLTFCKPKGHKKSVTTFTSNDTYHLIMFTIQF